MFEKTSVGHGEQFMAGGQDDVIHLETYREERKQSIARRVIAEGGSMLDRFRQIQQGRAQEGMDTAEKAMGDAPSEEEQVPHMQNYMQFQDLKNKFKESSKVTVVDREDLGVGELIVVQSSLGGHKLAIVEWPNGTVTEEETSDVRMI